MKKFNDLQNAENKYRFYMEKREELKALKQAVREEKQLLYDQKSRKHREMEDLKSNKDKLVEELNIFKVARNELNHEAKRLIELKKGFRRDADKIDLEELTEEFEETELSLQIELHNIKEEDNLIKRLRELKNKIDIAKKTETKRKEEIKDLNLLNEKIDATMKEAAVLHSKVQEKFQDVQKLNEKMDLIFKELQYLKEEIEKKNQQLTKIQQNIEKYSSKIKEMREKVIEIKGLDTEPPQVSEPEKDENFEEKYDESLDILLSKKRIEL